MKTNNSARLTLCLALLSCFLPQAARAHEDLEEAIEAVTERIEKSPFEAALFFQRAEFYRLHEEWAKAEADYAKTLSLDPNLHGVLRGRGEMLWAEGRHDEGLQAMASYLVLCPDDASAFCLRAKMFDAIDQWRKANADFQTAINLAVAASSPQLEYFSARADLLERHGRTREAVQCLDDGIAQLGGHAPTLQQAALNIEEASGDTSAAIRRIGAFLDKEPRRDIWLARRAGLLEKIRRKADALADWRAASAEFAKLQPQRLSLPVNQKLAAEIEGGFARLQKETKR